jgi:subtilase family serine protease
VIRKPILFPVVIVAMVARAAAMASEAQPQPLLTRHVRAVTLNGQAQLIGWLPATHTLRIDVVLPVRDRAGLESFLRDLYDPLSPTYRRYLTVEEFTDMFGPSQSDYDAVVRFAKANNFTVVGGSRNAMDVQLEGPVAAVESAFHVTLGIYQGPAENRTFYAPDREPTVDLPFQLWHISGLDNYSIPRPALERRTPGAKSNAATGSCPEQSFCGSDMRAAYYEGTSLTGAGQNIGLLEYAGFDIADVNTYYENAHQVRTATVTGISTDGTPVNCFYEQGCDDTEQTLDITQALGMAPGASTVYLYVGSTDTALLGAMSSDTPLPLNLSSSWQWTPADPDTDDPYWEKMAAQGQSFFQASASIGTLERSPWPSDSAWVTVVGGTGLTTKGPGGAWASEVAGYGGGGYYAQDDILIPWWQQLPGVINTANEGSTVYRNFPDVSANASFSFYVCADQGTCEANELGGTSFSAPMWAGYLALANEQAAAHGQAAPGFINPSIYLLGVGPSYRSEFHDIVSGNNGYPAVRGYDLASGWGSPNGSGLIGALLAPPSPFFAIGAAPNVMTVNAGSTFTSTITTAAENGFDSAVALSSNIRTAQFSPNTIPPPGSGTSTMTVQVAQNAKPGTYVFTITGKGGGITQSTSVTVTVEK